MKCLRCGAMKYKTKPTKINLSYCGLEIAVKTEAIVCEGCDFKILNCQQMDKLILLAKTEYKRLSKIS